ncbi:MAG: hypothetical protein H8D56_04790 [Planctomycetes bacterium]|nr:hypothetical protein [Planctomycetota bacterium]MBL7145776.1 hypothetical protein [Phycisphaerae bacterium]
MKPAALICAIALVIMNISGHCSAQGQVDKARARMGDLRFGSYVTSHHVEQLATNETIRARAWETIQRMGITKLYVEVYRGGHIVLPEHLIFVRNWLREKNIDVVGGIATVPGGDFGVRQKGPLGWFNWQNKKTQRDIEKVIRTAAGIFDTFIVDDFLCTGDVSEESNTARGNRSWGEYRRALLTELAKSIFVEPARQVNPAITMIVKYPQWYDRFHLFGYDTETFPQIFDKVWVGTETRGRNTQRFGFVQPYEGFINYRWLADIAGDKIGGAWFDHGDCLEYDFLDQAYMGVLAGAPELVFFNFNNIMQDHPDHEKVIAEFDQLAELAAFVREHPVIGIPAYKPPNSDPGGDMYIMDFLGMLGIPLVPVHKFPESAPVIFLPAQAAADPYLLNHIKKARAGGAYLIITTSLLIASPDAEELKRIAGISTKIKSEPIRARLLSSSPKTQNFENTDAMINLESPIEAGLMSKEIVCTAGGKQLVLLSVNETPSGRIALLNTHTYNQADFDAVGEVLLCPRPMGLLDMEGSALSAFRAIFGNRMITENNNTISPKPLLPVLDGQACVTIHPFDEGNCVVQNFNDEEVRVAVTIQIQNNKSNRFIDGFTEKPIPARTANSKSTVSLDLFIPARGRIWVRRVDFAVKDN